MKSLETLRPMEALWICPGAGLLPGRKTTQPLDIAHRLLAWFCPAVVSPLGDGRGEAR